MFNHVTISYIALMDVFFIGAFYIFISLIFRFAYKDDDPEEVSEFWIAVERFIERFHIMKIVYLVGAFLIIRFNLQIFSDVLNSHLAASVNFTKINLLIVANIAAMIVAFADKIALFQKVTRV
jgi:hypothetical protein